MQLANGKIFPILALNLNLSDRFIIYRNQSDCINPLGWRGTAIYHSGILSICNTLKFCFHSSSGCQSNFSIIPAEVRYSSHGLYG